MAVAEPERPYGECSRHDRDDRQRITQRLRSANMYWVSAATTAGPSVNPTRFVQSSRIAVNCARIWLGTARCRPATAGPIQEDCMKMSTAEAAYTPTSEGSSERACRGASRQ